MRILFLNSGGKDSDVGLQLLMEQNPNAEFLSLTIETADTVGMENARLLAQRLGVPHVVLPFEQTRQFLKPERNPNGAAHYWSFEMHFKGIQYAAANGFDFVASGHRDDATYGEVEDILNRIMDCIRWSPRIGILRPLRYVKSDEDFQNMKKKIKNPR